MFREEFYAQSDLLVWPLVGLLIFVAVFAGVLAFTWFGLRDRGKLDEIAALPLEDDARTTGASDGRGE